MIVRQFLHWLRTAPSGDRAEATSALARAYLYSDLTDSDRARRRRRDDHAARRSVAAGAPRARRRLRGHRIRAADHRACARRAISPTWRRRCCSVRRCCSTPIWSKRSRAARRCGRSRSRGARMLPCSVVGRDRRGRLRRSLPGAAGKPARRNRAVLARPHRRALRPSRRDPRRAAGALRPAGADAAGAGGEAVARRWPTSSPSREWLAPTERASASPARPARRRPSRWRPRSPEGEVRPLIRHLRDSGQLNAGLILRVAAVRQRRAVRGGAGRTRRACRSPASSASSTTAAARASARSTTRPGLPASTFLAFREALEAMREDGFMIEPGGASRLKRRIIERVLTRCENESARRDRAAAHAAAPLRRRGRARGGADVLRRAGRRRPDRSRRRLASGRGLAVRRR